jgi:hypothetical protein
MDSRETYFSYRKIDLWKSRTDSMIPKNVVMERAHLTDFNISVKKYKGVVRYSYSN